MNENLNKLKEVRDEQKEFVKEVNSMVSSGIQKCNLSVKSMKRVLLSFVNPEDKDRMSRLNDEEIIILSLLETSREQLIKTLAIEHAVATMEKQE